MSASPSFDPNHPRQYRCPYPLRADGTQNTDAILGWLRDGISEGQSFLRGLSAFEDIDRSMEFITGLLPDKLPKNLSKIKINHIKNDIREIAEILSNVRPSWMYESQNKTFQRQVAISNALHKSWFTDTYVDRKIHDAIIWAATCGTGYLSPYWKPNYHRDTGLGDIDLKVLGPKNFLPVQMPRDGDIQGSYAGIICETLTVHEVLDRFPEFATKISPTRSARSGLGSRMVDKAKTVLQFVLGSGNRNANLDTTPVVDMYYAYIDDTTVNNTGQTIAMGKPGSSWYYEVPSYQSDLPNGRTAEGIPLFRKANEQDSRIYPGRRLIIASDDCVFYDGPNYFWHGRIPIVKFTLMEWPWEPLLGQSLVRDVWSIQASLTSHYRAIDDKASAALRPAMQVDERVGQAEAEQFDPRQPGMKLKGDLASGELVKPIMGAEYYQVQQWIVQQYLPMLRQEIRDGIGLPGLQDMMKLRQMPASESLDKLAELESPVAQGMSRSMEKSIKDLGDMTNSMRYQFYPLQRRLRILGENGFTEEDFDNEPGTLIPSHMPEEDPTAGPSRYSIYQRGRWFSSQIWMHVVPLSLHQITQTSRKLLYLQLWRSQFPIDPQTVADSLDLPAWGDVKGDTILEKWVSWMVMQQELAAAAAAPPMPLGVEGQGGGEGAPSGNRPPGSPSREGRPPSGGESPHIEQKSGGRTTIAES